MSAIIGILLTLSTTVNRLIHYRSGADNRQTTFWNVRKRAELTGMTSFVRIDTLFYGIEINRVLLATD